MGRDVGRTTLFFSVLAVGLLVACAWSYFDRTRAGRGLRADTENLAACQHAAGQIERLRQQKQRALLKSKPTDELNRKVDDWARQAQIDPQRLVRIEPQAPRRVGDSQYLEQVTELEVVGATLPMLIRLAQLAEQAEEGIKLTSLRISPPRSSSESTDESETWNAELALTYLIYSPKSTTR